MKDAGMLRSEPLQPIDLGKVVEQPLDVGGHGRGLGYVGAGGVEAGLVRMILDADLLSLRGHEAVAAADGVRSAHLLPGGAVIIGETVMRRVKLDMILHSVLT